MNEKKVKEKFIGNFNKYLNGYEIADNYSDIVQKLENNGITLVRAESKKQNLFAYIYVVLTVFLCILTGLVGFRIGGNSINKEQLNPSTKKYLENHTERYYQQPIMTIYYSEHDLMYIYVGLVNEGDELVIHYFYYLKITDNSLAISFKNLNNNEEVDLSDKPIFGDISELITINNEDEIMCIIKNEEKLIRQNFITYHDIYIQLVEK